MLTPKNENTANSTYKKNKHPATATFWRTAGLRLAWHECRSRSMLTEFQRIERTTTSVESEASELVRDIEGQVVYVVNCHLEGNKQTVYKGETRALQLQNSFQR